MAGDADSIHRRDSDSEEDMEEEDSRLFVIYKGKKLGPGEPNDPKFMEQRARFYKQFSDSEGYDVDWDSYDYQIGGVVNFYWPNCLDNKLSNDEVLKLLIKRASDEYDEKNGTRLEFVKYEGANIVSVRGFLFYITFWAKDLNSSNPHPEPYQAKVCRFGTQEITVVDVRAKPTEFSS